MSLTDEKIKILEVKANEIRQAIIEALVTAGSGHTAGPLGMADIFSYLYFHELRHDPAKPDWPERDRLILSNGHICPVLYATMAAAGYFGKDGLTEYKKSLRKLGSPFQGHPHRDFIPALETSSGPLGSGLSQAVGMALAERIDNGSSYKKWFYCLMSDAELDEGNTWEAVALAAKERIGNLIAIVDRNNIQIDGLTDDIMPLEPLPDKWRSWNWHVVEIDGHNFQKIDEAIGEAKATIDRPSVLIARTISGKDASEFEGKYEWHGKPPNPKEAEAALKELRTLHRKIVSD